MLMMAQARCGSGDLFDPADPPIARLLNDSGVQTAPGRPRTVRDRETIAEKSFASVSDRPGFGIKPCTRQQRSTRCPGSFRTLIAIHRFFEQGNQACFGTT